MKALTLFELTASILQIIDEIVDAEIANDTEQLHALYAELDTHYANRSEKQGGYVHVIKNAEITAKACKAEAQEFMARSKALENLTARLKETLRLDLQQHGETSTTAGKFKIARQNGPPRVVIEIPVSELPVPYQRVSIEADKTALKDALKNGEDVEGVAFEATEHIRIRVR